MTPTDRVVVVIVDFDVDVVGQDVDDVGVGVGGPGSGQPQVGIGLDPPEGPGVRMKAASVSCLAEVLDPLCSGTTSAVALLQCPTASPENSGNFHPVMFVLISGTS